MATIASSSRIEELKRRVRQDPASIAFAALAEEYRRAGQLFDAIEVCRAGLQRHPAYLSARVTLGRALLEVGEVEEGREHLEQVLRVAPENLAAIRALAEIHHERADFTGSDSPVEFPLSVPPPTADTPAEGPSSAIPRLPAVSKPLALAPIVERPDSVAQDEGALTRLNAFLGAIARARETLLTGDHAAVTR